MIKDEIKDALNRQEVQRKKAEDLAKIVNKGLPLTWRVEEHCDETSYYLTVDRGFFGSLYYDFLFGCEFTIVPRLVNEGANKERVIGLIIYPKILGYNMAKKFIRRFEKKYHGQYALEIRLEK